MIQLIEIKEGLFIRADMIGALVKALPAKAIEHVYSIILTNGLSEQVSKESYEKLLSLCEVVK